MKHLVIALLFCSFFTIGHSQTAYIQVKGEPDLSVYLNGQFQGKTTAELQGFIIEKVKAGNNTIKIIKEGYIPFEETISVKAGEVLAYKVKPFVKNTVLISETGNSEETDKKATIATGQLVIQSVPIEIKITIPKIEGMVNLPKTKDVWTADRIAAGTYDISFLYNNKKIDKTITIPGNESTKVFVNMLSGEVTVKTSSEEKKEEKIAAGPSLKYVRELADKYKFKTGMRSAEFKAYNPEAAKLMNKKGLPSDDHKSISYIKAKLFGNSNSEGAKVIFVKNDIVYLYAHIIQFDKTAYKIDYAFDNFIKEIKANVNEKYLSYDKNRKGVIYIDIPDSEISRVVVEKENSSSDGSFFEITFLSANY